MKILKQTFLYIIPIALFINVAFGLKWKINYKYEGENYTKNATGFPFPSSGEFDPPYSGNLEEFSTDKLRYSLNGVIKMIIAALIFLCFKKTIKNINSNWWPIIHICIGIIYGICGFLTLFTDVFYSDFYSPFPNNWSSEFSGFRFCIF